MKRGVTISAALALCMISAAGTFLAPALTASANSAPAYWWGATGTGVFVTDENCPVEVMKEKLTLKIPHLPEAHYSTRQEFEEYRASVTAEYTFYNPEDYEIEMELAFPFGTRPEYLYKGDEAGYFDDAARYQITADGDAIEREVRYTYQPYAYSFDAGSMYDLRNEKVSDGFYKPEINMQEYSFSVTPDEETEFLIAVELAYNPVKTRILCNRSRDWLLKNGNLWLVFSYRENAKLPSFHALGDAPHVLQTKAIETKSLREEEWKEVRVKTIKVEEGASTTFGAHVEDVRLENFSQVSEVDYYNCVVDSLETQGVTSVGFVSASCTLVPDALMRWYTYKLAIPAQSTLVNCVTAPLYPTINGRRCEYRYLLSPALRWADFDELEIYINTPYEISDASLDFQKTADGYYMRRKGLPLGELTFNIRDEKERGGGFADEFFAVFGIVFVALVIVVVIVKVAAVTVVAIVLGVRAGKKKQRK